MAKLLHIEASPRKERSHSIDVARALIESYREANPADSVATWDLWSAPLPEFDEAAINASYAAGQGQPLSYEQQTIVGRFRQVFDRFAAADKYLISMPMWNFGIPYKLKHWIDVLTQPGLAFEVTPEGAYRGLLSDRKAVVVHASGAQYDAAPMNAMDHAEPYVRTWLGFVGITDAQVINVAPTAADPDTVKAAQEKAKEQAREVGASL